MRVGIISGYFNPIHTGHLDYIEGAKERCDLLYVIVNSDQQVNIKGSKQFMDEGSRLRIVRALSCVQRAMVSIDDDSTVCRSIKSKKNPKRKPKGTILAYSSAPGTLAYDGKGENSPYVQEIIKHIDKPGLKVEDFFLL